MVTGDEGPAAETGGYPSWVFVLTCRWCQKMRDPPQRQAVIRVLNLCLDVVDDEGPAAETWGYPWLGSLS